MSRRKAYRCVECDAVAESADQDDFGVVVDLWKAGLLRSWRLCCGAVGCGY